MKRLHGSIGQEENRQKNGSIINVGVELWRKSSRAFLSCQKKKQWSIKNKTFRI
jgi:hypothetical protein